MKTRTGSISLESVERLHGEELARISHALKTPLTSIIGFTSAILNDPSMERETWAEFMSIVKTEGERLSRFVDEMLYVSFGNTEAIAAAEGETTVSSLVNTALHVACTRMNQPSARFKAVISHPAMTILTDREFAIRVIGNVLGTAARFSSHNSQIQITADVLDHQLSLQVRSRRRGTSLNLRVSSANPVDAEATGLARTRFLLSMRGGTLGVRHEENGETTIVIALPVRMKEQA